MGLLNIRNLPVRLHRANTGSLAVGDVMLIAAVTIPIVLLLVYFRTELSGFLLYRFSQLVTG